MSNESEVVQPRISLLLSSTELQGPQTEVTWCLNCEGASLVREKHMTHVVLVARSEDGRETRRIARISDGAAMVTLPASGVNIIHIGVYKHDERSLRENYLTRQSGKWAGRLRRDDAERTAHDFERTLYNMEFADSITVSVPPGVFAPGPTAWERKWLTFMIKDIPEDECGWRQRRLFAYTVQAGVMALAAIIAIVAVLILYAGAAVTTLLLGLRGVNWSPGAVVGKDPVFANAHSIFIQPRLGWLERPLLLLMPAISLPLAFCVWVMIVPGWTAWGIATGGIVLLAFAATALDKLRRRRMSAKAAPRRRRARAEEYVPVCGEVVVRKAPIRLRYAHFKAKICRPVEGGAGAKVKEG